MTYHRRAAAATALLLGLGGAPLLTGDFGQSDGSAFVSSAHAQGFIKNLIARLRVRRIYNSDIACP